MAGQYVSSPVCTPSRFCCLTGRYASRADSRQLKATIRRDGQSVIGWNTMIQLGQVTLPLLLQRSGYRTGMVGKNHVIHAPGREKIGYREDPSDPGVHARLQAMADLFDNRLQGSLKRRSTPHTPVAGAT